jgi:hypothetical protein
LKDSNIFYVKVKKYFCQNQKYAMSLILEKRKASVLHVVFVDIDNLVAALTVITMTWVTWSQYYDRNYNASVVKIYNNTSNEYCNNLMGDIAGLEPTPFLLQSYLKYMHCSVVRITCMYVHAMYSQTKN